MVTTSPAAGARCHPQRQRAPIDARAAFPVHLRPRKQAAYPRPCVEDPARGTRGGGPQHIFVLPDSVTFKLNRIHLDHLGRQQRLITSLEDRVAQLEGQLAALGVVMHNQDAAMRAQAVHFKIQEDRITKLEIQPPPPPHPPPPEEASSTSMQEQPEDEGWQLPGWQDITTETHSSTLAERLDDLLELVEDHHERLYDLEHDDSKTKDLTLHYVECIKQVVKDAFMGANLACMQRQEEQLTSVQEHLGRDHVVLTQSVARLTRQVEECRQGEHERSMLHEPAAQESGSEPLTLAACQKLFSEFSREMRSSSDSSLTACQKRLDEFSREMRFSGDSSLKTPGPVRKLWD